MFDQSDSRIHQHHGIMSNNWSIVVHLNKLFEEIKTVLARCGGAVKLLVICRRKQPLVNMLNSSKRQQNPVLRLKLESKTAGAPEPEKFTMASWHILRKLFTVMFTLCLCKGHKSDLYEHNYKLCNPKYVAMSPWW